MRSSLEKAHRGSKEARVDRSRQCTGFLDLLCSGGYRPYEQEPKQISALEATASMELPYASRRTHTSLRRLESNQVPH